MVSRAALLGIAIAGLAGAANRYPVTGLVLQVDRPHRSFVASCAAIPGYMEAMSMPYSVRSDKEIAGLEPGAYIEFTLVVEGGHSYAESIRPHRFQSMEREPLLARRLQLLEPPGATVQRGQTVPDFTLIDQTGKRVTLSQFAGEGRGGHVHLHELPAAGLLFPSLEQFRTFEQTLRRPHGPRSDFAQHHLRSRPRPAQGARAICGHLESKSVVVALSDRARART